MGWSSGSRVAKIFQEVILDLPKNKRLKATKKAYDFLTDEDWDTVDEVPLFWAYYLEQIADSEEREDELSYLDTIQTNKFIRKHKKWCKKLGIPSSYEKLNK